MSTIELNVWAADILFLLAMVSTYHKSAQYLFNILSGSPSFPVQKPYYAITFQKAPFPYQHVIGIINKLQQPI